MCEHLMSSVQGQRYTYVYLALLKNNPKLIDDDLREQMATKVNTDVCDSCKNAVQTSKDFWGNALVRFDKRILIFIQYSLFRNQFVMYYFVHVNVVHRKINAVIIIINDLII
jgi:hypothetical protein